MFFRRGSPKLSKFMFNSFGGASTGSLFDGTYAFYPFYNNGDNTKTSGKLINERLSNKNFIDGSGNVKTVTDYQTAYTGSCALLEPSATNKCDNYNFKPTDFTNVTQVGSGVFSISSAYASLLTGIEPSNGDCYLIDNTGQGVESSLTFGGTAGNTNNHTISARVYVIQGSASLSRSTTLIDSLIIPENSGFERYSIDGFTADTPDRVLVGAEANSIVAVIANQLEEGDYPSSEIEVSGVQTTRAADKATIPTSDAWVDASVWVGNQTNATYTNGVRRLNDSTFSINMFSGNADERGKYQNRLSADFIGGIINGDPAYSFMAWGGNGNIITASHPNNTEQELLDMFGNTGNNEPKFSIHFEHSVYGDNNDLAGIKALMQSVGDYGENVITGSSFASTDASTVVTGTNIAINGSLTSSDFLASTTFEGDYGIKATDYILFETDSTLDPGNTGTVTIGGSAITDGIQNHMVVAFDSTLPITVPSVQVDTTGTIVADIKVTSTKVLRWLDFPTSNFTYSVKFTPSALTGEGDAIFYLDSNNTYYVYPVIGDMASGIISTGWGDNTTNLNNVHIIAGGIQVGVELDIQISVTDTEFISIVNGDVQSQPNTVPTMTGHWNSIMPLATSSGDAVYSGCFADFTAKDYEQQDFADNGDFANNGDFA